MVRTRQQSGLQLSDCSNGSPKVDLAEKLRTEDGDASAWLGEDLARVTLGTLRRCVLQGGLVARARRLARRAVLTDVGSALVRSDSDERSTVVTDAIVYRLVVFRDRGILCAEWVLEPLCARMR